MKKNKYNIGIINEYSNNILFHSILMYYTKSLENNFIKLINLHYIIVYFTYYTD
jgi:hypothetical protein